MTTQTARDSPDQKPRTGIGDVVDKQQEIQPAGQQPQKSPKTLTLDLSSSPEFLEQSKPLQLISLEDEDHDETEAEKQNDPPRLNDSHHVTITSAGGTDFSDRDPPERKKVNDKTRSWPESESEKKFELLLENFKPIPFVPAKSLDFSRHESLLKRLGLWEFVHMEFDRNVRKDLIAQFIGSFNPALRCSYVNGVRIKVSRADLARALKLPVRNVRTSSTENVNVIGGDYRLRRFMEDFLSTWILLHNDIWMMPSEIMNLTNVVTEGKLEKVDWAGLLWIMVEQELKQFDEEPGLENCYYASHMQCLIKYQREQLFMDEEIQIETDDDDVKMDGDDATMDMEVEIVKVEDVDGNNSPMETEDIEVLEEHSIESSLDVEEESSEEENLEDDDCVVVDDSEVEEERVENRHWLFLERKNKGDAFLQNCNYGNLGGSEFEREIKMYDEEEEDDDDEDDETESEDDVYPISPKGDTFGGMASVNHFSGDKLSDNFLPPRGNSHINANNLSLFGNINKRVTRHDNDFSHVGSKRTKTLSPMSNPSADVSEMLDTAEYFVGKARNLVAAKEHELHEINMTRQFLLNELRVRDCMIEQLRKEKAEEENKSQMEAYRLNYELSTMWELLQSYRNGLKETQRKFSEYREKCPVPREALYKDVRESGGLVLSTMELEKRRMKQEEEEKMCRLLVEKKMKEIEDEWMDKLAACKNTINLLDDKLLGVEKEAKLIMGSFAKRKKAEGAECRFCSIC